ncbi:hypothetical protein FQA47_001709 [Oryzias melastigma]|uniref:Uncharacterized protein n=1 Tax=Oryzias melastigma TaxID=30732 RepID=A0A834F3L6_ORYME|nr:hypothetical protein FQA47_001709 [Oryzias melastigma]
MVFRFLCTLDKPEQQLQPGGATQHQQRNYQLPPLWGSVCLMCGSLVDDCRRRGGESCGHVFLEVHGFTDTLCNIAATAIESPFPSGRTLSCCFRGTVKSSVRHIVRSETRWKVVSYDICCAHSPVMELHQVDFDRNQSGSMKLVMEKSVHL